MEFDRILWILMTDLDCISNFARRLRAQEYSARTWPVRCTSTVRCWTIQLNREQFILSFDSRFKNTTRPELSWAYLNKDQLPSECPTSMSIQVRFLASI